MLHVHAPTGLSPRRAFDDLRVRPKLVILHNLFFLVLTLSVYFSVIPAFAERINQARTRELQMVLQIFAAELPIKSSRAATGLEIYHYREGKPNDLSLRPEGQRFLNSHPNGTWEQGGDTLFRRGRNQGEFRSVSLSPESYDAAVKQAQATLFVVLGAVYILSILLLEFVIMPRYVYRPLRVMLDADEASQRSDLEHEIIDEHEMMKDEIGQIMRSRNQTVAQLRKQEENLATALKQLEEQDRLVSLGLLSTSVAHEINTPLAVLQGSIEKLSETSTDGMTLERLNRMLRVTQRLRKISESLIDFARVRNELMEPVELFPLIEESWSLVAIDEKASEVNFENLVNPGDTVVGNTDRLIQVFVNLLRNALIAVSTAGTVRVESKRINRSGQSWIRCSVMDDGPGIPSSVLSNLFEAFVSTRLDARGTGLGLTVAEGIVTQHGGTISASNRPEGGAVLEVVLPVAA